MARKNKMKGMRSVVGTIMIPKDVNILIPGICEYVRLYGKSELRMRMELKLLIR